VYFKKTEDSKGRRVGNRGASDAGADDLTHCHEQRTRTQREGIAPVLEAQREKKEVRERLGSSSTSPMRKKMPILEVFSEGRGKVKRTSHVGEKGEAR